MKFIKFILQHHFPPSHFNFWLRN